MSWESILKFKYYRLALFDKPKPIENPPQLDTTPPSPNWISVMEVVEELLRKEGGAADFDKIFESVENKTTYIVSRKEVKAILENNPNVAKLEDGNYTLMNTIEKSWEDILKRSVDDFLSEYLRLTRAIKRANKSSRRRRDLLIERRELVQSIPENMQDAFYDSLEDMDAKKERDIRSKKQQERAIAMQPPHVPRQKGQRNKQPSTKRTRSQRQAAIKEKNEAKRRKELEARERRAKERRDERRGL